MADRPYPSPDHPVVVPPYILEQIRLAEPGTSDSRYLGMVEDGTIVAVELLPDPNRPTLRLDPDWWRGNDDGLR